MEKNVPVKSIVVSFDALKELAIRVQKSSPSYSMQQTTGGRRGSGPARFGKPVESSSLQFDWMLTQTVIAKCYGIEKPAPYEINLSIRGR